jgi:enamine deaminase RidA (YjgF/YER057c/UK114 family)
VKSALVVAVLLISSAAPAAPPDAPPRGSRERAQTILSENEDSRRNEEEWGYSDAIAVGDTIYVSGVVAGLRPGEKDLEPAYERAFDEIGRRLARLGSSWGDVVEINSFHTDVVTQLPAMVAVKRRYVGPPYPAWTAIGVSRLIPGSGLTEIRVTAIRRR